MRWVPVDSASLFKYSSPHTRAWMLEGGNVVPYCVLMLLRERASELVPFFFHLYKKLDSSIFHGYPMILR